MIEHSTKHRLIFCLNNKHLHLEDLLYMLRLRFQGLCGRNEGIWMIGENLEKMILDMMRFGLIGDWWFGYEKCCWLGKAWWDIWMGLPMCIILVCYSPYLYEIVWLKHFIFVLGFGCAYVFIVNIKKYCCKQFVVLMFWYEECFGNWRVNREVHALGVSFKTMGN